MVNIYLDYSSKEKFKYIKNKAFIRNELKKYDYLFSNINGYSLDKDQRVAIVTDEVSTLLVAGAGSGKSLTMVGKIMYLIEKGIKKEEILCITFTREAAKSLESKLNGIKVYTFHSLSYSFLKENNYSIISNDYLEYIIDEYFNSIIFNSTDMICCLKRVLNMIDTPYKQILKTKQFATLKKTIITFINLFKSNNYSIKRFLNIKNNKDLVRIILDIYFLYEEELKSSNSIDYNDMIVRASEEVINTNIKYKYILVDEYQDTSYIRYVLLKKIIDKTGSKIICVGDDYQSIYRFNGCDISMFINFKKYFGHTKVLKISNTYRNSQELIDIAGSFIMKNKYQIYKHLKSKKHIKCPIIICYKKIYNLLDILVTRYKSVLILGRNNIDISIFDKKEFFYKECKIRCMTIHSSKGLEDECVVILNVVNDDLGIPSKLKNSDIIKYVSYESVYPYDEERRLFYVGLTRTKNEVYLLTNRGKESIFISELKKDYDNIFTLY